MQTRMTDIQKREMENPISECHVYKSSLLCGDVVFFLGRQNESGYFCPIHQIWFRVGLAQPSISQQRWCPMRSALRIQTRIYSHICVGLHPHLSSVYVGQIWTGTIIYPTGLAEDFGDMSFMQN